MFQKILIANRGEIAVRIIQTAQRLGIHTVAVYATPDLNALHVLSADEAFLLDGDTLSDTYLNIEKILAIAKKSGAEAIHPGYGFLSENAAFARACQKAGLAFVGPSPEAIEQMGSKSASKVLIDSLGEPLLPGYHGPALSKKALHEKAHSIGFPILLKASAGGGGKGMRIVHSIEDLEEAFQAASREAEHSFADSTLLLERYLENPRHIEVQIMADKQGHCVHLFERDCSIQRRYQKIIEEAPAVGLPDTLKQRLHQTALNIAKAIDYEGAGTLEFLVENNEHYYFMEMNTRLQVEHPVTEQITGLDLVEWQLRIAAGESLPLMQSDIQATGHAAEVRLYAEDPECDFLPTQGTLQCFETPTLSQTRLDTGVQAGDAILPFYDPMLAKFIAWDSTRATALKRLHTLLTNTHLTGFRHNLPFLSRLLEHPDFESAPRGTHFLKEVLANTASPTRHAEQLAALGLTLLEKKTSTHSPWEQYDGWRLNAPSQRALRFEKEGTSLNISVESPRPHHYVIKHPEAPPLHLECLAHTKDSFTVSSPDGSSQTFRLSHTKTQVYLSGDGVCAQLKRFVFNPMAHQKDALGPIFAPMPGLLVACHVSTGVCVEANTPLLTLEAMKMEHTLKAPRKARVTQIHQTAGTQVQEGALLLTLEAFEE